MSVQGKQALMVVIIWRGLDWSCTYTEQGIARNFFNCALKCTVVEGLLFAEEGLDNFLDLNLVLKAVIIGFPTKAGFGFSV